MATSLNFRRGLSKSLLSTGHVMKQEILAQLVAIYKALSFISFQLILLTLGKDSTRYIHFTEEKSLGSERGRRVICPNKSGFKSPESDTKVCAPKPWKRAKLEK